MLPNNDTPVILHILKKRGYSPSGNSSGSGSVENYDNKFGNENSSLEATTKILMFD